MTVTLSLSEPRDCIQVDIENDNILDPNEVFEVVLTTNTVNAAVLGGADTATVTINDNEIGKYMCQLLGVAPIRKSLRTAINYK